MYSLDSFHTHYFWKSFILVQLKQTSLRPHSKKQATSQKRTEQVLQLVLIVIFFQPKFVLLSVSLQNSN